MMESSKVKERISEAELSALLMRQIRKHPEWNDVIDVRILRPINGNWDVSFIMGGLAAPPEGAYAVATVLQTKYHLA